MLISKTIEIDMAHRVPSHKGKCRSLHGHRYKIEVGVDDILIDTLGDSSQGMVIDFGDLKEIMMQKIDARYDHNSIFYQDDPIRAAITGIQKFQNKKVHFVDFIPTAENLAKHWFQILRKALLEKHILISHVTVFETPTSTATYTLKNSEHDN